MKQNSEKYFHDLMKQVEKEQQIAVKAREKNLDPVDKVEVPLAMSLAEKSIGLIASIYPQLNDKKIINRILDLEKQYGQLDVAVSFKIAEETAKERYCKFSSHLEAIDAGIRVGFAYNTLGVVASPIEGFTQLKLGKTKKGEEYFIAYFSGPIRSAGTTATCMVLMLIDYLRELFGYAKYDPSEEEVKRYVTENYDYHERVTNLQYLPAEEEIEFLAKNLPIQIAGEPTEKREVSNYKDLERVDTNKIRGGMCLAFSEGLAQKAQKGFRLLKGVKEKGFKSTGWDFLEQYIEMHKQRESGGKNKEKKVTATYIKDLVAGRPVYGHPSKSGGFRFRYGRSRVSGFSSVSVHPATMGVTNNFLSSGLQLKIEKPTKGCIITACDNVDGPIVKLNNGGVRKLESFEEADKLYNDIEEIIYLGDILFPLGDVINRNAELIKPGYVEEWWEQELRKKLEVTGDSISDVYHGENLRNLSLDTATEISDKYSLSLHPNYIYYWTEISEEDFFWLLDWLQNAVLNKEKRQDGEGFKIILPYSKSVQDKYKEAKRALELLGVEHDVVFDNIVINHEALLYNLGFRKQEFEEWKKQDNIKISEKINKITEKIKNKGGVGQDVLEIINSISCYNIKDKAGDFIGARMGRPEKAKLRKLTGSPNVLFPIGEQGGRLRSVYEAVNRGFVKADFPLYYCEKCDKETIYRRCEGCDSITEKRYICPECKKISKSKCDEHEKGLCYLTRKIDSKHFLDMAVKHLNADRAEMPEMIKGVRGTSSSEHDFEHLAKGILRAKHHLNVNKDGTIRYDGTEIAVTHFKAKEVDTSVEKLRELGYDRDWEGNELENDEQILELKPHDVILPASPDAKDERADIVFMNITRFIDEELERFYGLNKYYNVKKREDLVGKLVACMAPHNCAGVIGRIIGFCKLQGLVASPYMHAAMRRDCFAYDTYMPIKEGRRWNLKQIGDVVEDLNPKKERK